MAKVKCPECKATVEVDPKPGATVECDECGKKFRLAAPKPAAATAGAAAGAKPTKRAAAPPDDDEDEDDEPVVKKPKKKKRKKAASMPGWLLPAIGGVTVIGGLIAVVVFVVVPTMKRGLLFDPLKAIQDDVDSVAVVHPKGVAGASGISAMAEQMKGGGSHYAPTPPEGYGFEAGHVTEATRVTKGLKTFYIIHFEWTAKPTTPAVATHRDVPIREDKPKHLDKPRYVVVGGKDMCLYETVEDAKEGIDRMLDSKKAGFRPDPKYAGYFTRAPGDMREIFTEKKGTEIAKPKTVYAELSYKDYDYDVTYTLDYGTKEAAEAAKKTVEESRKATRKEIDAWWKKTREDNPGFEGNPFFNVEGLLNKELQIDGSKLVMKVPFSKASHGASMPLVHQCFNMGDAPFAGFKDLMEGMGK